MEARGRAGGGVLKPYTLSVLVSNLPCLFLCLVYLCARGYRRQQVSDVCQRVSGKSPRAREYQLAPIRKQGMWIISPNLCLKRRYVKKVCGMPPTSARGLLSLPSPCIPHRRGSCSGGGHEPTPEGDIDKSWGCMDAPPGGGASPARLAS